MSLIKLLNPNEFQPIPPIHPSHTPSYSHPIPSSLHPILSLHPTDLTMCPFHPLILLAWPITSLSNGKRPCGSPRGNPRGAGYLPAPPPLLPHSHLEQREEERRVGLGLRGEALAFFSFVWCTSFVGAKSEISLTVRWELQLKNRELKSYKSWKLSGKLQSWNFAEFKAWELKAWELEA